MPTIRDLFRPGQLRWSDVNWGPVDPLWPAISFSRGTTAWSQLKKLDDNDVVVSVCAGQRAEEHFKRRITGILVPHHFTALTKDIVHPDKLREADEQYGADRWPDSIACRAIYRILDPPSIDRVIPEPRLVTGTQGRYLADLTGFDGLFDRLADLEVEELQVYRSPQYTVLASQPRQANRRQARWTSTVPPSVQGILDQQVRALFASAAASGGVYEYVRPDRRVPMEPTPMLLMLLELWEAQDGRCDYCRINLETAGLAQVSIDRIDNDNREYGRHNVHLTCWECNRGKGTATHEEMIELWEKRKLVWSSQTNTDASCPIPHRVEWYSHRASFPGSLRGISARSRRASDRKGSRLCENSEIV